MANPIFQSADQNILRGATWAVTAGTTVYNPAYFRHLDPSIHVVFNGASGTLIATIPSARGDVLVIPVSNAYTLTVSNGAGLSVSVPVPAMPTSRVPLTLVCDLSVLQPNQTTRTSNVWGFAFTSISGALAVGAAIAIYSPRRELLEGDFQWGGAERRSAFGTVQEGPAGVRYLNASQTMRRAVKLTKLASQTDAEALKDWFDGSWGQFGTSFLWADPDVNDGYLGTLADRLEVTRVAPTAEGPMFVVGVELTELSKGRPL